MHDRCSDSRRTDYEQSRPAPSALTSVALAAAVPLAVVAVSFAAALAAAAPRTAVLLAVPLLAVGYRRRG